MVINANVIVKMASLHRNRYMLQMMWVLETKQGIYCLLFFTLNEIMQPNPREVLSYIFLNQVICFHYTNFLFNLYIQLWIYFLSKPKILFLSSLISNSQINLNHINSCGIRYMDLSTILLIRFDTLTKHITVTYETSFLLHFHQNMCLLFKHLH